MDSSVAQLATGASFKSSVGLLLSVEKALSAFFSSSAIQFLYSFPLLFNKISAVLLFCRHCTYLRARAVLYLWNLFLLLVGE